MNPLAYEQIISLLGLIALWAFWYYLWKPQRVDIFRQRLFSLRSDLFDLAADGVVPFDHPAYAQLRLLINGMIRFAHRVSFATLVIAIVQSKRAPSDPLAAWRRNVEKLPEGARERVLAVHKDVSAAFSKHLIDGSMLLSLFVFLRVLIALFKGISHAVGRKKEPTQLQSHPCPKQDGLGKK
jgi:hypothetical protein